MSGQRLIWLLEAVITILGFRILCAGLAASLFIAVMMAVRKRLPPVLRTWLWNATFLMLFLPFERSITAMMIAGHLNMIYEWDTDIAAYLLQSPITLIVFVAFRILPYLWLAGFLFFAVKSSREAVRTHRMLKEGTVPVCAAYLSKWRYHVYLPPDFDTAYTRTEQEMLLAHERQHISQHDPLWYRLLPALQCVFWFCPFIHKAARLFQRDREILCDERVTQSRSKREYGFLLLKEAQKKSPGFTVPGIVSEMGDIGERVDVFITPIRTGSIAVAAVLLVMSAVLGVGLMGLPSAYQKEISFFKNIKVLLASDYDSSDAYLTIPHIEGMEQFVLTGEDGIVLNQEGLYEYAVSMGLAPEQRLRLIVVTGVRPVMFDGYISNVETEFEIGKLMTETIFIPINELEQRIFEVAYSF